MLLRLARRRTCVEARSSRLPRLPTSDQRSDDGDNGSDPFHARDATGCSRHRSRDAFNIRSQLGPIDPQMPMPGGRSYSARAIVDQFDQAKAEITADPVVAHAWAPVLASLGPALVKEASNNLEYSEKMVANWLDVLIGDVDQS